MDHSFRLRSDSCKEERIRGSRETEPTCLAPPCGRPRQNRWTSSISACSAAIRRSASLAVRLSRAVLAGRLWVESRFAADVGYRGITRCGVAPDKLLQRPGKEQRGPQDVCC